MKTKEGYKENENYIIEFFFFHNILTYYLQYTIRWGAMKPSHGTCSTVHLK